MQRKGNSAQPEETPFISRKHTQGIQPKLTISQPADRYEQEADRVAKQVMRMPEEDANPPMTSRMHSSGNSLQRMCNECENKIQRKTAHQEHEYLTQGTPQSTEIIVHRKISFNGNASPRISALNGSVAARFPLANYPSGIQRMEMDDEDSDDEMVQMKSADRGSAVPAVTPGVEAGINSLKSGGQPLSESTRAFFEPRFGHDFS